MGNPFSLTFHEHFIVDHVDWHRWEHMEVIRVCVCVGMHGCVHVCMKVHILVCVFDVCE